MEPTKIQVYEDRHVISPLQIQALIRHMAFPLNLPNQLKAEDI